LIKINHYKKLWLPVGGKEVRKIRQLLFTIKDTIYKMGVLKEKETLEHWKKQD